LDSLFTHPVAAPRLRASPLGAWLDSFADWLADLGYTPGSCRSYVVLAADLGRWLAEREMGAEALNEAVISAYVEHRKTQPDRRRAASRQFLAYLRADGVAPPYQPVPDRPAVALHCDRYAEYMRRERGVADTTIDGYVAVIRDFLIHRFGDGDVELSAVTATAIGNYLVGQARELSTRRVIFLGTALRSFFRYAFARGEMSLDLSTAVLTARSTHHGNVPRYLPAADVERLLTAFDLETPSGRRDRAIVLLLARLGLRPGEVVGLDLDDIRWRSGEIVVRGKGGAIDRLPLLREIGEALALYLVKDRPRASSRRVFLRLCAPNRGLAGAGTVQYVVKAALKRAGLRPMGGAHFLRHSLGTRMIRAGASLAEIGQVLRHHAAGTAEIYAKVDFETLRALAHPWPGTGGAR
jgi:site-specific recombinase XerD